VYKCQQKVNAQRKVNDTQIFVDEVETQLGEKPLRGSQTQEFHYSEDIARYKTVTLTCTDVVVVP
jgi:cytochrome oxidase assembly protein ShyY1